MSRKSFIRSKWLKRQLLRRHQNHYRLTGSDQKLIWAYICWIDQLNNHQLTYKNYRASFNYQKIGTIFRSMNFSTSTWPFSRFGSYPAYRLGFLFCFGVRMLSFSITWRFHLLCRHLDSSKFCFYSAINFSVILIWRKHLEPFEDYFL